MRTKVTKEEFEMLLSSCGYTMSDFWKGEYFYFVGVKEQAIVASDIELLQIEGLELHSIGIGVNGNVELEYCDIITEDKEASDGLPLF